MDAMQSDAAPTRQVNPQDKLVGFVQALEREADNRVSRRTVIEQRWIEDLRQYHGQYDAKTLRNLREGNKSKLFINVTRSKTDSAEARLFDMLFPTDDKNWGIGPTPVPELSKRAQTMTSQAALMVDEANRLQQAGQDQQAQQIVQQAEAGPVAEAVKAKAILQQAKEAAEAMQDEIADQLIECDYAAACRDVIRDACQLGIGIIKGPVASQTPKRKFEQRLDAQTGRPMYEMADIDDARPAFYHVDPWSFFPDPDALTIKQCDGVFERHLYKGKDLRRLARMPGYNADAIAELLRQKPRMNVPTYLTDIRNIVAGDQSAYMSELYQVWEYYGSVSMQDMVHYMGQSAAYDDVDPLAEVNVCVVFCDGKILKLGEYFLDSGDPVYSVFNYAKDNGSIWGYGVPYIMRDSQAALNSAWRMMMDNAGLSTGPQILMDQASIEPADGSWTLEPRKIWLLKQQLLAGAQAMVTFEINSHQGELMAIVELARRLIDEETGISQVSQGEQGATITKTAQGMAMLMNSSNVMFKRVVKNFDDDLTVPNIQRVYQWNMQFSEKENIKGDFKVDARGSSVLLVRDMQSSNLGNIVMSAAGNPMLAPLTKFAPAYRKWVQSMQISADDFVKTDEEIEMEAQEAANNPPPPDPEMLKLQTQKEIATLDSQTRLQVAQINRDVALMKVTQDSNVRMEELEYKSSEKRSEMDHKERQLAVETAMTEQTGETAGGLV